MKLESLIIQRNLYGFEHAGVQPGGIAGTIKIAGRHGSTEVRLTPQQIDQMLAIVAEAAIENTRELADCLTREVIEHARVVPALAAE